MTTGPPFERRVKMDKVNRFVFDIAAEYFINTDWHPTLLKTTPRQADRNTDWH
jgi:hypothetical protein